jgi:hypothetical protein
VNEEESFLPEQTEVDELTVRKGPEGLHVDE